MSDPAMMQGWDTPADEPGLACLICGSANSSDAVLCLECSAPMALVQDARAQKREPQIVSVLGESNVGKTVYLGFLLDMLSRRAQDFEAIPRGAYSIDLQQSVIAHMTQRTFPPKTAIEPDRWNWAYYQVRKKAKRAKWLDLVMPDMAGEALAAEIDSPQSFRVIGSLLGKSSALLMLVDAALAVTGATRPDFFALKILSYIDSQFSGGSSDTLRKPIAVVLCKADHCPESFDDPDRFMQANLPRTWNLCQSRFRNVRYFSCSTVGALGYATGSPDGRSEFVRPIPLHTSLQGVLEPFEWILSQG